MSMQNLAIVFGPTLFGQHKVANAQGGVIADTTYQNQVRLLNMTSEFSDRIEFFFFQAIETILNHYTDIFIDESEWSFSCSLEQFMHHQRCFVLCFFFSSTYLGKLAICIYIPPHTRSFFFSLCWNSKLFLLSICFGQGRLTCVCVHLLFPPPHSNL